MPKQIKDKEDISSLQKTEKVIEQVATEIKQDEEKKAVETVQLIVFELDKEEYGVGITELKEIINVPDITPIPNSPKFISGIINLRGKIVVIIDLEKRFNLVRDTAQPKQRQILIAETDNNTYGLTVDYVKEVLRLPKDAIKKAPELITAKIDSNYLKGVGTMKNRIIVLLDMAKVLSEKGLVELSETMKKVQAKKVEEIPQKETALDSPAIT